jgi:hypothetical protein
VRFQNYLAIRWNNGVRRGRFLFSEVRQQGYTGSFSHLERLLSEWRLAGGAPAEAGPEIHVAPSVPTVPPISASFLCIKPRTLLSPSEVVKVDWLKATSPAFATMRQLAMRFRGILRGTDPAKLERWLGDASRSALHGIRRFAQVLLHDIDAVRHAISERWSNGQTEGQINRLKTLKRAMYGRAGTELLRARMLPLRL